MEYVYNCLVMSGLPGSGKSSLVEAVSKETSWPIHSVGGMFRKKYESMKLRGISFEEWWPSLPGYEQKKVNFEAVKIAKSGNVILDTRYAELCRNRESLLVFMTAPLETRVKRAMGNAKYLGKTPEEIKKILKQRENDELNIGENLFSFDYRNPNTYSLVLNSGSLTVEQEASIVMSLLKPGK